MRSAVLAPAAALVALAATPALAHHPLAGAPMESFAQGLASGFGHPVLGFDHLAFVIAAGLVAGLAGVPFRGPLAYVAAMLTGCLLAAAAMAPPAAEAMVAISLAVVGGLVVLAWTPGAGRTPGLLALFGLFHGAAFGESIAGWELSAGVSAPAGYLLGLAGVQTAIAAGAALAAGRAAPAGEAAAGVGARLAGAMVAGIGVFLSLEMLEGWAFAALV